MERNIKVNIREFEDAHLNGLISDETRAIGRYLSKIAFERALRGEDAGDAYLSQEEIDAVLECEKDHDLREEEYQTISLHRLAGMEADKEGNLDEALKEYTRCIEIGEAATHYMYTAFAYALERIIVVLHKLKDYRMELYYIEKLLTHELNRSKTMNYLNAHTIDKYEQRSHRVFEKWQKQQKQQ